MGINEDLCIHNNGFIFSNQNDEKHKVDGPSHEWSGGDETWWFDSKLHRKYGPARKWGNDNDEWWFEGEYYSMKEFMERFL